MNQLLRMLPLFILSAVLESFTHICLKKASALHSGHGGLRYYLAVMKSHLVWLGIGAYLIEMFAWLLILTNLPLSIAFPASGIQKIVMVFIAVFVMREPLNKRECVAMTLIGMGLICAFLAVKVGA